MVGLSAASWVWNNAIIDGLVRQDERVRDGKMRSWELGHYVFPPGPGHTSHISPLVIQCDWSGAE
jgi:hypothetical protein